MPYKDKDKEREYHAKYKKEWVKRNRARYRKYQRDWQKNNRDKTHKYSRKYYYGNKEKELKRGYIYKRERYQKLRMAALEYYGGKCVCCGESRLEFLAIDHTKGNGRKHRQKIAPKNIWEWLKSNNYPKGFQVLCHNCNLSKGFYGYCPHQIERGEISKDDIPKIREEKNKRYGYKNYFKKKADTK